MNSYSHVKASDWQVFPYPTKKIWPVLLDFGKYHEWWPFFVFFKLGYIREGFIGSMYKLRPYGWKEFTNTVSAIEVNQKISIEYSGNFMTGRAEWHLEELPQGTQVAYDMDGQIDDLCVALVGVLIDLHAIHSFSMKRIFTGLARQVSR